MRPLAATRSHAIVSLWKMFLTYYVAHNTNFLDELDFLVEMSWLCWKYLS
jgi:hypothetical protein